MSNGGFAVYEGLVSEEIYSEGMTAFSAASDQESREPDHEEIRGGTPQRKLLSSGGGIVQDAFYRTRWLSEFLSNECQLHIHPSGTRGSYSYYARPGDFLGIHRDIETCDIALISVLHDNSSPDEQGGTLIMYPDRLQEPLSYIRNNPSTGAVGLKLMPGQTIVLLGGIVPHQILPVTQEQIRIISILCFQVV